MTNAVETNTHGGRGGVFAPADDLGQVSTSPERVVLLKFTEPNPVVLQDTGAAIWALLDGRRALGEIVAELSEMYRHPAEAIAPAVEDFCRDLARRGYLQAVAPDA